MLLAVLIPLIATLQRGSIWLKMLSFASVATKTSIIILVVSVLRDDWMMGMVGVLILTAGNAALMLLAQLIRRMEAL
jgi:multicomponent Na+:H+ antiporter subunit F